jgi:phosphoglycolate phosphatase-like HAD superfamily hydrolase
VTFDIDGTLIKFGGESRKHPMAMTAALNDFCGLQVDDFPEHYLGQPLDGWTDLRIASELLKASGGNDDAPTLRQFRDAIVSAFLRLCRAGYDVVPHASECLEFLCQLEGVVLTVATGNFEQIARKKLELAGLSRFFRLDVGGYGEVLERRDALLMAERKCAEAGLVVVHKVHIGDTPSDAIAAVDAGFVPVIVTTGRRHTGFPDGALVFPGYAPDGDSGIARFLADTVKQNGHRSELDISRAPHWDSGRKYE